MNESKIDYARSILKDYIRQLNSAELKATVKNMEGELSQQHHYEHEASILHGIVIRLLWITEDEIKSELETDTWHGITVDYQKTCLIEK